MSGTSRSSADVSAPQPQATITREGERELRATLGRLRHELEVDFVRRLSEARAFGESGSNDEYLQILEEEAVLSSRVARIERLLDSAKIVDRRPRRGGTVAIGTTARVKDLASGAVEEFRLIGDYETMVPGTVSASSPIGRGLLGQPVKAEVGIELPDGRERRLRILSIRSSGNR